MNKIVAIDFDDTITEHRPYPQKAPLNKKAKKYLIKINDLGYDLVFWSSRQNKDHTKAFERCLYEFDLDFIKADSEKYTHGATGKLDAFFFIDDKSYFGKIPWGKIYRYLKKNR